MYKLSLLTISALLCLTSFAQPVKTVAMADKLLNKGINKAIIITYEFPNDIKNLQSKALKNLKANPEWADKYIVRLVEKGSKTLDYKDAYGLTRPEFDKMVKGFKDEKKVVFKDTFNLKIVKQNGLITFKGDKKLSAFNYLIIDTKNNKVIYDNYSLTREVELTGQKSYAPILLGYETFWGVEIPNKKQLSKVGGNLSIGKNIGDDRTTLCLILQYSISNVEYLTVTLI